MHMRFKDAAEVEGQQQQRQPLTLRRLGSLIMSLIMLEVNRGLGNWRRFWREANAPDITEEQWNLILRKPSEDDPE